MNPCDSSWSSTSILSSSKVSPSLSASFLPMFDPISMSSSSSWFFSSSFVIWGPNKSYVSLATSQLINNLLYQMPCTFNFSNLIQIIILPCSKLSNSIISRVIILSTIILTFMWRIDTAFTFSSMIIMSLIVPISSKLHVILSIAKYLQQHH